jgi:hypothetical protein
METLHLGQTDGVARTVTRTIVHREGNNPGHTITTQYDMKAITPMAGASYRHVRKEVEYASWAKGQLDSALAKPKPDRAELEQMLGRMERFLLEHQPGTEFRPALDTEIQRVKAVLKGAPR